MDASVAVAKIEGEPLFEFPNDLYIPPDYLEILLERFEGPLDLLLYLIRKKNFDIFKIPIKDVTLQYMTYLRLMKACSRDIAVDYLLMAGTLIEIKSRLMLPKSSNEDEQVDEDPRAELARRLLAYEQCQKASELIDELERIDRDFLPFQLNASLKEQKILYDCCLNEIALAYKKIMERHQEAEPHQITKETLTMKEAMVNILEQIQHNKTSLQEIFSKLETKHQLITYFLAILQLAKEFIIQIKQDYSFGPVELQKVEEKVA